MTELTKEDLEQLKADIEKAQGTIGSEAIQKAKEEARKEAEKEMAVQKKLEEQERKLKEAQEVIEKQKADAQKQLEMLQKRVDEMAASKAVVPSDDPFKNGSSSTQAKSVDQWPEDRVAQFEEESKRVFFGDDLYNRILKQVKNR
jgi:hypothetical protein